MDNKNKPLFEQVANELIEQLKKGTSPFQKPWNDMGESLDLPYNPTTNLHYKGMNSVWLMMQGHADPRWLTFKQAEANGWRVSKGAKASLINFVKYYEKTFVKDEDKNPILDENGEKKYCLTKLEHPIITSAHVFNGEDIPGLPPLQTNITTSTQWEDLKRIEKLVSNSGIKLHHGGNAAYYNPLSDSVTLPQKNQFSGPARYYSTLLHEMGHWTGHSSRLNRTLGTLFGTEDYAKEELRAEIASLMTCRQLKIGHDFGQHAAYVKSWVSILGDQPFELYRATTDAQKIMDYILSFEHKRDLDMKKHAQQSFMLRDQINLDGERYEISGLLPSKKIQATNLQTGKLISLSPKEELYISLMKAKQDHLEKTNKDVSNNNQTSQYKSFKR